MPDNANASAKRPLSLQTPLPGQPLSLTGFSGIEGLSQLFRFELNLISAIGSRVNLGDLLGKRASVTIALPNDSSRTWNGVITQFGHNGQDDLNHSYTALLEPSISELKLRSDFRVFQETKVDDLLAAIFDGFPTRIAYTHAEERQPLNYRVQYGETDFDFASRLMEEAGIFYYFEHADEADTLVLTDDSTQSKLITGAERLEYDPSCTGVTDTPTIKEWQLSRRLMPESVRLRDTHFQAFNESFEVTTPVDQTVKIGEDTYTLRDETTERVVYRYPGGYAPHYDGIPQQEAGSTDEEPAEEDGDSKSLIKKIEAEALHQSKLRSDLLTSQSLRIDAKSDALLLLPGGLFKLSKDHAADGSKMGEYLIARVVHEATLGVGSGSGDASTPLDYRNEFNCQPSSIAYRAERRTRKPIVAGVQTATVVADLTANEADRDELREQLYDKYGRVKVRFAWDRRADRSPGESDESDKAATAGVADRSCWVRVAQPWAGNRWGAFFWPRHGHEVLVAFEHGDPDRPVIIGSLYNATNMPPLEMPAKQKFAGIMSCSVNGVASESSNGFTFHDELGNEHFEIHSEANSLSVKEDSEHNIVLGTSVSVNGTFLPW